MSNSSNRLNDVSIPLLNNQDQKESDENTVYSIADFPEPLIHEKAIEYINKQYLHTDGLIYTIIGVDNKPPKAKPGIYFTLKVPGRACTHVRVGNEPC